MPEASLSLCSVRQALRDSDRALVPSISMRWREILRFAEPLRAADEQQASLHHGAVLPGMPFSVLAGPTSCRKIQGTDWVFGFFRSAQMHPARFTLRFQPRLRCACNTCSSGIISAKHGCPMRTGLNVSHCNPGPAKSNYKCTVRKAVWSSRA